jgi:hypothetical protein
LGAPLTGREKFDSPADLGEGQDAGEKGLLWRFSYPMVNILIRLSNASEFGEDVGIKEKTGHRSTGLG